MKRVLVYSHDTFGLGNIRRMLAIARHLVETTPEVSVLFLTGSPMLHAFRIPARIDYVKLPCLARDTKGSYRARSLPLDLSETVRLRSGLIASTITEFKPDLILVDKKPYGVEDELARAIEAMPRGQPRPRLVLLLRDILDGATATRAVWKKNAYYQAIEAHYHEVLVVGHREIFDLADEYAFPPFAAAKLRYCGYIARGDARRTRAEVRAELGIQADEPFVLVTPGGGEDGAALVNTALESLAGWPAGDRPRAHIVCGPEMAEHARDAVLQACAALPHVSAQVFSDDMMGLVEAADVVVSMAGYNTVSELLAARRRAVVVPRTVPSHEQLVRAQGLAQLGLVTMLHPDDASPSDLTQAIARQLDAHARGEPLPPRPAMDGLEQVSRALREWLGLAEPRRLVGLRAAAAAPMRLTARG